ncbi:MAG: murein biosynthesis integral membrane protein MurJ [Sphingomonas sanxanigenens]|uniref:Probable lipid II flippase MurJ n=1 Tax=Sphingomonas sanxanigenens TaxID=397260 RepID=A0A2W5A7H0_9SPHN|nr:MAG: murein biosynthesis integral membrane protein MurJ [Sphingomonas sanxanigenens]
MNLVRATATIGGLTLISRILGFVRDMLMARFVGAGLASDAFLIAWRLPNLFRALFAEGAFASAFVPMFNRTLGEAESKGHPAPLRAALDFTEQVLSVLLPLLIVFTIIMMFAAAPIVWAMTGGFPDGGADKFDLTVQLTRITFPYLALISLVSLLGGILNSLQRFWVNAAAPILLNICMIVGLIFFRGHSEIDTARTQAIAVTVSGVMQLGWLMLSCRQAGVSLRLRKPSLSPQVRKLLAIIWPAALGAGAVQFNLLISTTLAARFLPQGAVSYLYYADRLNQLPLGLIGIGVGTAILPTLSRQIGGGNDAAANHTQNRAMELSLLLTLPATAAFIVSAVPLIRATLQHGVFSAADTIASANALAAFSIGLPAYVLIKVLTPGFYARADTRTPVRIALLAMLVNLVGNLILIWPMGHVGLALSTAVSAWVNVGLLYLTLHRRGQFSIDAQLRRRTIRLLGATIAMTALLLVLNPIVDAHSGRGLIERIVAVGLMIAAGGIVYFGAAFALRAYGLAELKQQLRRRPPAA